MVLNIHSTRHHKSHFTAGVIPTEPFFQPPLLPPLPTDSPPCPYPREKGAKSGTATDEQRFFPPSTVWEGREAALYPIWDLVIGPLLGVTRDRAPQHCLQCQVLQSLCYICHHFQSSLLSSPKRTTSIKISTN